MDSQPKVSKQKLSNRTVEFPCINNKWTGKENKYTYFAGSVVKDDHQWGPIQCLVKMEEIFFWHILQRIRKSKEVTHYKWSSPV